MCILLANTTQDTTQYFPDIYDRFYYVGYFSGTLSFHTSQTLVNHPSRAVFRKHRRSQQKIVNVNPKWLTCLSNCMKHIGNKIIHDC